MKPGHSYSTRPAWGWGQSAKVCVCFWEEWWASQCATEAPVLPSLGSLMGWEVTDLLIWPRCVKVPWQWRSISEGACLPWHTPNQNRDISASPLLRPSLVVGFTCHPGDLVGSTGAADTPFKFLVPSEIGNPWLVPQTLVSCESGACLHAQITSHGIENYSRPCFSQCPSKTHRVGCMSTLISLSYALFSGRRHENTEGEVPALVLGKSMNWCSSATVGVIVGSLMQNPMNHLNQVWPLKKAVLSPSPG